MTAIKLCFVLISLTLGTSALITTVDWMNQAGAVMQRAIGER